jgi:hypothetical protein
MERKAGNYSTLFLPNYFKKIGVVLIVLTFAPILFIKLMGVDISLYDKNLFRIITFDLFILGLLFVVWAKDKIEDERVIFIKFKSMAWAFFLAVLFALVKPLMDFVFEYRVADLPSQILVISMLVVYILFYFIQKRSM